MPKSPAERKDALEELTKEDWRVMEFFRLGYLHSNNGNIKLAAKCSSSINKWKAITLINHDRVLHGRPVLFGKSVNDNG
ncbi:hypothetical protein [Klebsiella quasipneumoniae]|uniref:hypothetical protein n=1 Tax=Klebsiella quasipneumoniae TaxID=1463165 RepID=UPI00249BAF04|nr:hypothetical protein [Klebsiella quasipneumoniae]MDI3084856.1 hypothetical protein [Klebsiella quasipneumoniae]